MEKLGKIPPGAVVSTAVGHARCLWGGWLTRGSIKTVAEAAEASEKGASCLPISRGPAGLSWVTRRGVWYAIAWR